MPARIRVGSWHFRLTPTRYVLLGLVAAMAVTATIRFVWGLGSVTNLSDRWPWGLWIGFDLLCGIALAGGGFSTALIVHVLHKNRYLPVARAALLTSLLGYVVACASLLIDVGRWHNFWRPYFFWGYHSILFEVFWCISTYTVVQVLEFGSIFLERVRCLPLKRVLDFLTTPLLILGIVLPTLHQSSLGALFVVAVDKLNPLWWSMLLPFYFVWSAFFLGPAMVTLEGTLAARAYRREPELPVFRSLTKVTMWMMVVYLIVKAADLSHRGVLLLTFSGSLESNMFLLEMIVGVILPILLYAIPSVRGSRWGITTASALVVGGVILNRINVNFTGIARHAGVQYLPSLGEWLITLGLWSVLILAYCFIVENFPILPKEEPAEGAGVLQADLGKRGKRMAS